jgi:protein-S-isoprenylcysteine O-methyltransferase Ste14
MFGFLLQFPTVITLVMFPVLMFMHVRLAHPEEHDALEEFGDETVRHASETPGVHSRFGTRETSLPIG